MATILVTSRSFSSGSIDFVKHLAKFGHTVVTGPPSHDLEQLCPLLSDAVAWIAGTGPITASHLDAAPKLRIIARYGVGVEAVDFQSAAERGIAVTNTPGANSDAVADHTIGLMLAVLRGTTEGDRRVRAGDWSVIRGRELGSLTVGILGFGKIGQGVARRLSGFGSRIVAHDPWLSHEEIKSAGAFPSDVISMATGSDIVTIHAPGGPTIIDRAWLSAARAGQLIINTARPELVDERAVADALHARTIGGFAADTLTGDTRRQTSPLLAGELADRVIVTPHIGAQTIEAVDNMGSTAVTNVLAVLSGNSAPNPVPTKV